jgi:CRISPR-associated endonuclease/helicase Cas3
MKTPVTDFWGKLRKDEDTDVVVAWHPLADHCADVAACAEALLTRTLLRRRLARLGGQDDLDDVQVARLCVLAALHDLGKFNQHFQNKGRIGASPRAGHVREVLWLFQDGRSEGERLLEALSAINLDEWAEDDVAFRLLVAAVAHHGRPIQVDNPGVAPEPRAWLAAHGLDPFAGVARLARDAAEWFPGALKKGRPFPRTAAFQHGFAGVVMLADWLGSDRSPERFPFSEESDTDRITFARGRAARALRESGVTTDDLREGVAGVVMWARFCDIAEPREIQAQILTLPTPRDESVVLLESETGSGKTEAALAHFFRLYVAGAVDGMYFALPTRTAATQMFKRVRDAVGRFFAPSPPPVVLAVPGYLAVDDARGKRLAGFEVLWKDDTDKTRSGLDLRHRGWAAEHPKRYLSAAIAVGTIDQALLSALMVDHAHLRATSLLRSLLVVDEVHASDAYMNRLLVEVLDHHRAAGGHALLMSATLGSEARDRLLDGRAHTPFEVARAEPYPRVTYRGPGGASSTLAPGAPGLPKKVEVTLHARMGDALAIARRALDAARGGARVLVVRNTVRGAVEAQEALESLGVEPALLFGVRGVVAPHHARYAKVDREALDAAIEARFGRGSAGGGCVCVATQTVQQSLDLDADFMITDLCPMDVLLQRIGRLFRHSRVRPNEYASPRCEVNVPEDDLVKYIHKDGKARGPHGIGRVYEDLRILRATWLLVRETPLLDIPSMNRELVEATTHRDALDAATPDDARWRKHRDCMRGVFYADRRIAEDNAIDRDVPFGDACFRDVKGERLSTRLGESDRVAEFAAGPMGPFGTRIERLNIPAHLAQGAGEDAAVANITERVGGFSFSFGELRFRYDRLGLRREEATIQNGVSA